MVCVGGFGGLGPQVRLLGLPRGWLCRGSVQARAGACVRARAVGHDKGRKVAWKPMAPGQPRRLPCPLVDTEQGRVQLLVLVPVFAVAHWPTLDRAVLVLVVCLL